MNLIEQLGGYEKLNPHFVLTDRTIGYTHIYLHGNNHYCFLDESVDYIIPDRAILIKDVFDALLEYRRQHNIYEVGDNIVLSGGNCTLMYKLHERIGKYVYLKRPSGREYEFHIDEIRHATDAEIAAGRRL